MRALQVMENHLKTRAYFAAGQLTVADIALYGYTHVADRCDYDLATFPAIRAWLRRVEQTPGFVTMDWQPGPRSTTRRHRRRGLTPPAGIGSHSREDTDQRLTTAGITLTFAVIWPFSARSAAAMLPADVARFSWLSRVIRPAS